MQVYLVYNKKIYATEGISESDHISDHIKIPELNNLLWVNNATSSNIFYINLMLAQQYIEQLGETDINVYTLPKDKIYIKDLEEFSWYKLYFANKIIYGQYISHNTTIKHCIMTIDNKRYNIYNHCLIRPMTKQEIDLFKIKSIQ